MKEIKCQSGNTYGIVTAYGVMSQLEGAAFEAVSDETMDKLRESWAKDGGSTDEFEDAAGNIAMDAFDGKAMKDFMIASRKTGPSIIAKVLRTFNGDQIGPDFNTRLRFVNEEMDYEDGVEVAAALNDALKKVHKGQKQVGKSGPNSKGERTAQVSPQP